MPSKTSKPPAKPRRRASSAARPKAATGSSNSTESRGAKEVNEAELARVAHALAPSLKVGDWVLLEGPLGAGKTTFAKALLEALGIQRPPEGSPTFAIAHEYATSRGLEVVHLDLYRLRSEAELEEAGVPAYFWERDALVLCEWLSMWPEFEAAVLRSPRGRIHRVVLGLVDEQTRMVRIARG